MLRLFVTGASLSLAALVGTSCDSDDDDTNDVDPSIAEQPGVPFDQDVTPGVDTPTDEVGNQGFETDDQPGPVGQADPSPAD